MQKITSKANERIKHLKRLFTDKDYRNQCREYPVEGLRAIDGMQSVRELYVRDDVNAPKMGDVPVHIVVPEVFSSIAETENSQGIIAVAGMAVQDVAQLQQGKRYLLLDRIQDPGNMGTLIRTACAFGFSGIIVMKGCVDPYAPKVVRSAASALGKIDLFRCDDPALLSGYTVIGADMIGSDTGAYSWPAAFILAIGNEANGLSDGVRGICSAMAAIPIAKNMESLNAAVSAGILMYAATKGRIA